MNLIQLQQHKNKIIAAILAAAVLIFIGWIFLFHKTSKPLAIDCSTVPKVENATIIKIENNKFDPQESTIKVCETLLFLNLDDTKHWPKSDGLFDAGKDLAKFDYFTYQLTKAGTFDFYDQSHREITGKLTIENRAADVRVFKPIAPVGTKTVYLTFDADMTPGMLARMKSGEIPKWYDDRVFKYLETKNIPAVIFTTGLFARAYPDLVKELGSFNFLEIGNHSYDHPGFENPCYNLRTIKTDNDKVFQITETQKILKNLTGQSPKLFRFPGLCSNAHDQDLIAKLGLSQIDSNPLVSGDAFNKNANVVVNNILNKVKDGSVILMHIGGPNSPVDYEVLKTIVPKLEELGYSLGLK